MEHIIFSNRSRQIVTRVDALHETSWPMTNIQGTLGARHSPSSWRRQPLINAFQYLSSFSNRRLMALENTYQVVACNAGKGGGWGENEKNQLILLITICQIFLSRNHP